MIRKFFLLTLIVACFAAILVEVNYLAYSKEARWDLTQARQHTLSAKTQAIIQEAKTQAKITVLHVGIPPKYLEDLLKEYKRISQGSIDFEIIDPIVQIGYAAQFGQVIKGSEKKAIVQSGGKRRDIDFTEEPLNENHINNALIRVSRQARMACFLTGHGEYSLSATAEKSLSKFSRLLIANNIASQDLFLESAQKIPEDCNLLVIAGPNQQIPEIQVKIIQEYLEKGGDALVLIENTVVSTPDAPLKEDQMDKNPSLDNLLNPWGVAAVRDIVVDLKSHASGDVGSPATNNYMSHKAITSDLDYTFYVRPRSIKILNDRKPTLKLAPIVLTASPKDSWGEADRYLNIKFDEAIDRMGPIPIAFVVFEEKAPEDRSDTRLAIYTDADFLSNDFVEYYDNAKMGLNIINWLTESDFEVFVDKNEVKVQKLDLTSAQKRQVGIVLIAMPIAIALLGIGVWWKRRV